ncbi:MAG: HAD-IIB family hydrolase, partial [Oscillospiraceae bacterium]|nr:HAD-IIB family hydrolase [Oscillospiraceae bacterium]
MKYKILVLDVDGTLTNSEKQISEKTKKALMHAQKKGVKLVIASGRPTFGVMPFVKELEMEKYGGYVLSFNGAKITDCKTGKIMYEDSISPEMVPAIYDISKEHRVNIITYENDTVITETLDDEYLQIELRINKMSAKKVDNFKDYVKFSVPKFIMLGDGDYLGKIEP